MFNLCKLKVFVIFEKLFLCWIVCKVVMFNNGIKDRYLFIDFVIRNLMVFIVLVVSVDLVGWVWL